MESLTDFLLNDKTIQRARLLEQMGQCLRRHLPAPLNERCWVSGYNDDTLFLVTDTGSCATMIYCHHHQLLKQFNVEFRRNASALRKVRVRAAPGLRV